MINADEVEQLAAVLSEKEAYLSRPSIPSLASCDIGQNVITEIGYKYNGFGLAVLAYRLAGVSSGR